ncbi:diguanylate cyclase domain-containing protein [Methylibium sp. Pch-M]|uniref:sensor domain-containing diguanylate cyclase n=1 Tax=Methylibium sp. Pch-M TaxID=2082386 RepID=UPI0013EC664D|nr:diguanylate cyclase [Methylibium sp. Pch-M]
MNENSSARSPLTSPVTLHSALLAAAVLLLAVLGVVTQLSLDTANRNEVQRALRDTERNTQKLAVRVGEVLDRVDQTTLLVKSLHETGNPMSLSGLRAAGLVTLDTTRALLITDRRGVVQESTSPDVALNLADEDDFKRHLHDPALGLSIGAPQPDHLNGGWMLPVMRRLTHDGQFDGVVVAMLDPGSLTKGFDHGEAPGTVITVIGLDNINRSRRLDGSISFGEKVDAQKVLQRSREIRETLQPFYSQVDGTARFFTALPIDRYPMVAVVAVSADAVTAGYQQTRLRLLGWSAAVALLIVFGTLVLWRQARGLDSSRREARRAKALYVATLDGSLDALWLMRAERDASGQAHDFVITDANRRAGAMLGLDPAAMIGRRATELVPSIREDGLLDLLLTVLQRQKPMDVEAQAVATSMRGRWMHFQVVPVEEGVALITRDIDDRKRAEGQLADIARRDALTQLPNRRHFEEQLELAAARAQRSGRPMALVYLDLDGFKRVNDTLGHEAGDRLLISVALRLTACVRVTDLVSRLGGDEFTVILEESGTAEDRLQLCERILAQLSEPHLLAGQATVSTPSLGMAVYLPGESLDSLRKRADGAMYDAKRAGKACLRIAASASAVG